MKKKYTVILAALLSAALLISACSKSEQPGTETDPESESTSAPIDTPDPEEDADASDAPTSTEQGETVTAAGEDAELLWTETDMDVTMYVAADSVSSYSKALEDSEKLMDYSVNEKLRVIAITDTGFYKLENGGYVMVKDLSEKEVEISTLSSSPDATIYTTTPAQE